MSKNLLRLTAAGAEKLSQDVALKSVIDVIADRVDNYSDGEPELSYFVGENGGLLYEDTFTMFEQFEQLPLFTQLPPSEQFAVRQLIKQWNEQYSEVDDEEEPVPPSSWGIVSQVEDGLFPGRGVVERFEQNSLDVIVLTGAGALDVYREAPGLFEQDSAETLLQFCQFAGAALATEIQKRTERQGEALGLEKPSFTLQYQDDPYVREIYVGADFHGDFRMIEQVRPVGQPVDPAGNQIEFLPDRPHQKIFGAYHSVEPEITQKLLEHVLFLPDDERKQLIETMIRNTQDSLQATPQQYGNFADAGDGDGRREADVLGWAVKQSQPLRDHYIRAGVRGDSSLRIRSLLDGIVFHQLSGGDEAAIYSKQEGIFISNEDLPLLMNALVEQSLRGDGRTSVHPHLNLLESARKLLAIAAR